MKKKILRYAIWAIMVVLLFSGCDRKKTESVTATNVQSETGWPKKTIKLIVPFRAGGDTDFHARTYAKYLSPILGESVVVVNVNGANGSAGSIQVKDSKPDGYNALFFHDSMLMNKVVGVTDFAHEAFDVAAAGVVDNSYILAVNSKSSYKNLDDLIVAAKKTPGQITYASSIGGYTYYVGCMLEEKADVAFNKVDAGGGSDRNAALLANKIDTNVNPYGVMKPFIDSGDFRVLCVFSEKRSLLFPDVPTAIEQGYDITAGRAYFMSFPKGTDPSILEKMSSAIEQVSKMPEYSNDISTAYCVEPSYMNTSDTKEYLDAAISQFMGDQDLILGR